MVVTIKILVNKCDKNIQHVEENEKEKVEFPLQVICDECDSKIQVDEEDLHIGWLGEPFFTCPCCGRESMVEEVEGVNLTIDTLEFPKHFYRTNNSTAKEVSNKDVVEYIRKGVLHLRKNKEEFAYTVSLGDTRIHVYRYEFGEDSYEVYVSKDTYEASIPFEKCDYAEDINHDRL